MTTAWEALLWASGTTYVARLATDGTVRAANPALVRAAGEAVVGKQLSALVPESQRPAFSRAVIGAGDRVAEQTLSLAGEDRVVRLVRDEDGILLVAEPVLGEEALVAGEMLALNRDLIDAQRDATRRGRELERSRTQARAYARRVREMETIVLAGLVHPDVPAVVDALLVAIRDVAGGDGAMVELRDERSGDFAVAAATGRPPAGAPEATAELRAEDRVAGRLRAWGADVDEALLEAVAERGGLALGHVDLARRRNELAEALQRSVLPHALPDVPGVRLCARYLPRRGAAGVGGDFYDASLLDDGRLALSIGDVAGKGLAAASTMGQLCHALRAYAAEGVAPGELLARLDRQALEDGEQMVTALHLRLDPGTGALIYANAGHPPALRLTPAGETAWLEGALAPPLGAGLGDRGAAVAKLEPGDRLFLFTDGLIERRGEALDASLERLAADAAGTTGPDGLCGALVDRVHARDGAFEDDVAVLALEVSGGA